MDSLSLVVEESGGEITYAALAETARALGLIDLARSISELAPGRKGEVPDKPAPLTAPASS